MKTAARNAGHGFALCLCALLAGCAATAEKMIYHGERKTYDAHLQDNMDVGAVVGGQETSALAGLGDPESVSEISNEAFAGALKQTLASQGLLADDGRGRYVLSVQLINVDKSVGALRMNTVTSVQYVLKDTQSQAVVMKETIVAEHEATISDSFFTIAQMANEGSAKNNIEQFLVVLSALDIKPADIVVE